jgi:hypothetical protein
MIECHTVGASTGLPAREADKGVLGYAKRPDYLSGGEDLLWEGVDSVSHPVTQI